MKLETICDFKNLESYLEEISAKNRYGINLNRREFVMVGKFINISLFCFKSIKGRSNVGKSSLINSLVQSKIALTSNYPVSRYFSKNIIFIQFFKIFQYNFIF